MLRDSCPPVRVRHLSAACVPEQPTSDDTGGLLKADWETPEAEKLEMLKVLPSTDVFELVGITPPPEA